MADLLQDKRTCPEETVCQIGNIDGTVPPEVLAEVAALFFKEISSRFGEHVHILDWSLHLDETTPHFPTEKARGIIGRTLDAVKIRINKAASKVLEAVRARLHEPAVPEANTAVIRTAAKESVLKKLRELQEKLRAENTSAGPVDKKRIQDIEH